MKSNLSPNWNPPDDTSPDELLRGFEAFNQTAQQLEETYREFEEKVQKLSEELAEKNRELQRNLEEKERVQNYLADVFDSTTVGLLVTDANGQVTSLNRKGTKLLGRTVEEVRQLGLPEVLPGAIRPWEFEPGNLDVLIQIRDRETEVHRPDDTVRLLRVSASALHDSQGSVNGVILNLQDITELKRLEGEAERRNRLTGMGEVAASVAHTIRNPLGSIELFTGLLRSEMTGERGKELLRHISSATQGINHVISNLIEYSRPRALHNPRVLDLHELLRENLRFSHQLVDYGHVTVRLELKAEHPWIHGDEEPLRQVCSNLLLNALQATLDPGEIVIATRDLETRNRRVLDRFAPEKSGEQSIQLLELSIQDFGVGMAPEVLPRIFDPFYTTKEHGAGLGLAIVRHILDAHGVFLEVESREGEGTRFIMVFPVSSPEA
jgi:PAS domain S-box-containing protein